MFLCSGSGVNRHDEVCYERGLCPACVALEALRDEEGRASQLEEEVSELKSRPDNT
jgi:hypothetical protein